MKRRLIALLLIGILMLVVGCGKEKDDTVGQNNDLQDVTLRVGQTGWGVFEENIKAAGLDDTPYKVEYTVFQGGNLCLEAMAGNHIDLTETSEIPPLVYADGENKGNFKIIAIYQSNTLNQELITAANSPIQKIMDLKGKKVAYVKNTTAQYFLLKMLQKEGMTWSDITPVDLTTSDGLMALLSGEVDALASYGNSIISAHQQGAVTLGSAKEILSGNFPIEAADVALQDEKKKLAIEDYIKRVNKALSWAKLHPQEWSKIVAAHTHQPYDQAYNTFTEGVKQRDNKIVGISQGAIESQQDIANQFSQLGIIKKTKVDDFWSHVFDESLNE